MDRRHFLRNLAWTGTGLTAGLTTSFGHPGARRSSLPTEGEATQDASFLYILRLALAPGHQIEERTNFLIDFCREASIDDIAFILWAEELNTGHPTPQETDQWLGMVEQIRPRLDEVGVTTSLNPWVVLQHADRGRTLKQGQDFQLMVDPDGNRAAATACPLCPELQTHLRQHYRQLARIQPRIIWVDDDFRLHNHSPLQWGGCFCDLHLKEYSRRAGRTVSREEFVRGVLQPGKPHPYRKIWLETSRDTMVNLAGILGDAVRSVSPETQVGLMSSNPAVHCVEGRDWNSVLRGFAGNHPPVNRPHLPSYTEAAAAQYLWNFNRVSRLSTSMVPTETRLYPELENWPHSRFSKSRAFSRFQIEAVAAIGAHGIAMDIFDLFGNGVLPREGYASSLTEAKKLAERIRGLRLDQRNEAGVQVLFSPHSSETIWTETGTSFSELQPEESFWASFLSVLGIAQTYRQLEDLVPGVAGISGQYFRGLTETQIRKLLNEQLTLLNGDAVSTLVSMGLGSLLGIRSVRWHPSDSGIPSFEQVVDGNRYAGVREGRLTAQALTGAYLEVEYDSDVAIRTEVYNPSGKRVGPGMAVVAQRSVILPYGKGGDYQGLRHPIRQELLQHLLTELADETCPVFLKGEANVAVHTYPGSEQLALLLINASTDDCETLRFRCPGVTSAGAQEVSRRGIEDCAALIRPAGDDMTFTGELKSLEVKALVLNRRESMRL